MRWLVDGYNVTKGDPATAGKSLEEQRDVLVRRLAVRGRSLLGSSDILLVFDGRLAGGNVTRHGGVEVRFTRDESADDAIVRLAHGLHDPFGLVTSDSGLAARVRSAATVPVRVEPRERVYEQAVSGRKTRRMGGSTAGLPKGANRITEELKRIWLEEDER